MHQNNATVVPHHPNVENGGESNAGGVNDMVDNSILHNNRSSGTMFTSSLLVGMYVGLTLLVIS